jgi:hypothetical protein
VVEARRTDNGDRCTLIVVHERYGGGWAFYPHGFGTFGVRLEKSAEAKVAQAILADGAE